MLTYPRTSNILTLELFFNIFTTGIETFILWDQVLSRGRRSLPPEIGTAVTLISASLSYWKRSCWPNWNFLRRKKRWITIVNADSMPLLGVLVSAASTSTWHTIFRDNFVWQGAGYLREMTAVPGDDEFRSALCSLHSKTLWEIALHSRRELE